MAAPLDAPPPLPHAGGGPGASTYASRMPPQEGEQPQVGAGAGMGQTGNAAIRLSMEIDAALKTLLQMVPQLGPWVEKTTVELRMQLGNALSQGAIPTDPEPHDNQSFPGGMGNL